MTRLHSTSPRSPPHRKPANCEHLPAFAALRDNYYDNIELLDDTRRYLSFGLLLLKFYFFLLSFYISFFMNNGYS